MLYDEGRVLALVRQRPALLVRAGKTTKPMQGSLASAQPFYFDANRRRYRFARYNRRQSDRGFNRYVFATDR